MRNFYFANSTTPPHHNLSLNVAEWGSIKKGKKGTRQNARQISPGGFGPSLFTYSEKEQIENGAYPTRSSSK